MGASEDFVLQISVCGKGHVWLPAPVDMLEAGAILELPCR